MRRRQRLHRLRCTNVLATAHATTCGTTISGAVATARITAAARVADAACVAARAFLTCTATAKAHAATRVAAAAAWRGVRRHV